MENSFIQIPDMKDIIKGTGMPTLYRVAFSNQLDSIFTYGYNRAFTGTKGGNMYGPGVYCTFRLSDSINNVKTKPEYGNCIIEMRLSGGFQKFIIFDEHLAKSTYGARWKIENQLMDVAGMSNGEVESIMRDFSLRGVSLYHGRTAPAALYIWTKFSSDLFKKRGVRGLIYKGNRDGHCALPYDFSSVIPYAVSFDEGKTFKPKFNEGLYNFLKDHADVEFRFGGRFRKAFPSVKGFTLVKNKEGKYNVIQNSSDKLLSKVWFDEINSQISAQDGTFEFMYGGYEFIGSIYAPQGYGVIGCLLNPLDNSPLCFFSDLNDLVKEIKANGFNSLEEMLMASDDGEDDNMVSDSVIKRAIMESINSLLYEEREVDNDGTVTINNFDDVKRFLLTPESNDDVWFVQIIKRHKDNPNEYFARNACEYIASYLIHNSDELEEKKQEIISTCHATNSRAYMHPNKRSLVKITDYANNVLKPRFKKYGNRAFMGHELDVAAGQAKDWDDRKLCFLDIDSDDTRVYNMVMTILRKNGITPLWEYRSVNNGWHILLPDKEKARNIDFSSIDNGNKLGRWSTVGLEIDKPILLYARLKPNGYGLQKKVQQYKIRKQHR